MAETKNWGLWNRAQNHWFPRDSAPEAFTESEAKCHEANHYEVKARPLHARDGKEYPPVTGDADSDPNEDWGVWNMVQENWCGDKDGNPTRFTQADAKNFCAFNRSATAYMPIALHVHDAVKELHKRNRTEQPWGRYSDGRSYEAEARPLIVRDGTSPSSTEDRRAYVQHCLEEANKFYRNLNPSVLPHEIEEARKFEVAIRDAASLISPCRQTSFR